MNAQTKTRLGLTGNQLKLLALITMTCDHIGVSLFPQCTALRIIGRLSLPIFAYMIAEGCRYTRNRTKYFFHMAVLALVCQVVYFFAMGSLYQCILVTFSLSILLIYSLDYAEKHKTVSSWGGFILLAAVIFFLSTLLPALLPHTNYGIDYGFFGIVLPLLVFLGNTPHQRLLLTASGLCLLALDYGGIQWFSLASIPILALYTGTRGQSKIKYLFYIYYPAHLVVIYLLSLVLR